MGDGGGQIPQVAEPHKRNVSGKTAQAETSSLLRRRGLEATKMNRNSLGGGQNLGGM